MRVFGYSRVSTGEQAGEGASLDVQAQQIAGYAMMKGWRIDKVFVERGLSGSTPPADRPEGKRLLATIDKGDVVVTAKLDRTFRSAADALGGAGGVQGSWCRSAHDLISAKTSPATAYGASKRAYRRRKMSI
jgi:hypothetical protein